VARELGMNPKKFGSLANHKQEPWELLLPQIIEKIYFKHFKKRAPENVKSIEQIVEDKAKKYAERKAKKELANTINEKII